MENRKLRSLRTLYKINQTELAKHIGINLMTYSYKENGKTPFYQSEMITIVNFFKRFDKKLTMDDIFFINEVTEMVTKN